MLFAQATTAAADWSYGYNPLDWLTGATNAGDASLTETFTCSTTGNPLTRARPPGAVGYPSTTAARPRVANACRCKKT
jgi:hypothetical protein